MKIDEMPASRTMDLLIREKVLGYVWPDDRCPICGWLLSEVLADGCVKESCSLRPAPEARADSPAPYSSSDTVALGVLHHKGWLYSLHNYKSLGVRVVIYSSHPESSDVRAQGTTMAEAICRAALKMVGEE